MLTNRLPLLATMVLGAIAVALAVVAGKKTFDLFEPVTIDVDAAPTSSTAQRAPETSVDIGVLLSNPLFGRAEVASTPTRASAEVRDTRLRIQLLGVVAGSDGDGVAVLSHDGKVRSYLRGQALDMRKKVVLHSVFPDHVLIEHSGVRERISLKDKAGKVAVQGGVKRGNTRNPVTQPTTAPANVQSVNLQAPAIRSLVGDVRETVTTSPLKLVRFMTAQPWSEGQYQGYRIQPGIDKRLLPYLRLKPGDVVLAVNDRPIRSIDLGEVNNLVNNSDRFALRVLRNGQEIGINLDL